MDKFDSRTIGLIKEEGVLALSKSKVAIFGVGGVGGTCLEALVRSNVGQIDIYDFDGENFRNKEVISTFINLPSRTKKRANLSEKKERVMKVYCPYQDFQLYNIPALQEILEKENHLEQTKRVLKRV